MTSPTSQARSSLSPALALALGRKQPGYVSSSYFLVLSRLEKKNEKVLLAHGAKVYIAARNRAQSEETIRQLKQETGNEAIFLSLDLANLKAIKAAAEEFQRSVSTLALCVF